MAEKTYQYTRFSPSSRIKRNIVYATISPGVSFSFFCFKRTKREFLWNSSRRFLGGFQPNDDPSDLTKILCIISNKEPSTENDRVHAYIVFILASKIFQTESRSLTESPVASDTCTRYLGYFKCVARERFQGNLYRNLRVFRGSTGYG